MNNWFVLRTVPGKEEEAVLLMQKKLDRKLWIQCRVLKKEKLLRSGGQLFMYKEDMFPGYIFIQTDCPAELQEELNKAGKFPSFIGNRQSGRIDIVPVEDEDLKFLKSVCGDSLQKDMTLSKVKTDEEGTLQRIDGILSQYKDRIVKKRLRGRYVLVSVRLFNREEDVLFGIRLDTDEIGMAG